MISNQRFAIDKRYKLILMDLGISPSEVLKKANLPRDLFSQKKPILNVQEYFALWRAIGSITDNELLPLGLGQSISAEAFSPPLFAAFCSPNGLVCVNRLSRFKRLIGPMVFIVTEKEGKIFLEIQCLIGNEQLPSVLVATELVFLTHLIRIATREEIVPVSIMTQNPIDHIDYVKFFKTIPTWGQKNKMVFRKQDLEIQFLTENESLWEFFSPELHKRLSELDVDDTFSARVRSALIELLPAGNGTIEMVASKLGYSVRTLQRYLSKENTTFQKQLNHTRELLARHYLTQSDITHEEISFLIGYDDPNSFTRAFHIWTGMSPGDFRKKTFMSQVK